jgi:hypothetical protein
MGGEGRGEREEGGGRRGRGEGRRGEGDGEGRKTEQRTLDPADPEEVDLVRLCLDFPLLLA